MDEQTRRDERKYFAASNSADGFVSYYDACFGVDCVDQLYVIKGGPGTGKSRFMRDVAEAAEAHGCDIDYYYCSSDPHSLDGIRITGLDSVRIGLIDGTAPHAWEPALPGVREELINLGQFWNGKLLQQHSTRIRQLNRMKKQCYDLAYHYLHGCGEMEKVRDSLIQPCIVPKKIERLADRILRNCKQGNGFYEKPALQNAVGMTGCVHFSTFENEADTLYLVEPYYGAECHVMQALLDRSREKQLSVLVSRDPVCPQHIDGLYWPVERLGVVIAPHKGADSPTRRIYLSHYTDAALLDGLRGDLRHAKKTEKQLLEGACNCLDRAAGYHFELESIYIEAMDFAAKEGFSRQFCKDLFG